MFDSAFPTVRTPVGPVPAGAPAWNPQRPSAMPHHRYQPAHERVQVLLDNTEREWPSRKITQAPLWVPVDLRDGNQALPEPMDTPRKRRLFDLLTTMGFKEIEVAYPSASQTDYDFVRHLATSGNVPATLATPTGRTSVRGTGNGPLAALVDALAQAGTAVDILSHAASAGPGATAAAYARCRVYDREAWGGGWDTSPLTASVHAVMAGVSRAHGAARG